MNLNLTLDNELLKMEKFHHVCQSDGANRGGLLKEWVHPFPNGISIIGFI